MSSRLSLYDDDEEDDQDRPRDEFESRFGVLSSSVFSNLGVRALDIAPDVDDNDNDEHHRRQATLLAHESSSSTHGIYQIHDTDQSGKKKYAKEAWPGRHPHAQLPPSVSAAPIISTAPDTMAPTFTSSSSTSTSSGAKRLAI